MNNRQRPNVLCVISDDTPFRSLGYIEGRALTPNLDCIRHRGIHFSRFYATSSVCTPSRFSYLTGLYAGHCPAPSFQRDLDQPYCLTWNTNITPATPTVGKVFQAAGYRTGYVGKWHCGVEPGEFPGFPYRPDDDPSDSRIAARLRADNDFLMRHIRRCGFDRVASVLNANADNHPIRALHVHNHEWYTRGALDFLETQPKGKPFFLYVCPTAIHGPSHVDAIASDRQLTHRGYLKKNLAGILPPRHTYFERLERAGFEVTHQVVGALMLDDFVGALLAKLREMGADDNTIVLYKTDHGWDTAKTTCCEDGMHIPATLMWPGHLEAGSTCPSIVQNIDFLPTIADLCGVPLLPGMKLDGRSRKAQILRGAPDDIDEMYGEQGYLRSLRRGPWRYIAFRYPDAVLAAMRNGKVDRAYHMMGKADGTQYRTIQRYRCYWDADRLHHVETDPGEQVNLFHDPRYADIAADMQWRLQRKLATFHHRFDLAPQPFVRSARFQKLAEKTSRTNDLVRQEYYLKGAV